MMHYRILKCESVFTTWYEVQKRIFGFFWVDLYWNWIEDYDGPIKYGTLDRAKDELNIYKCQIKKTVIYEE